MSEESIETKLARIEERQIGNTDILHELRRDMVIHSKRIEALESWRSWIVGVGAGVSAALGFLLARIKGQG